MKISIVIPNWNGEHLLAKNLPKVIASSPNTEEIIVVDDGSTDGSLQLLREKFPSVRAIARPVHKGFASSVNDGVSQSMGDIVMLLNTDVIPTLGYLDYLTFHFDDEQVFAVGCLEKSHEGNRIVLRGRGEAKWEKGFFIHWRGEVDKTTTAWVSGGSGAFRKTLWDLLGGMDKLYDPFYWEDIDLSYRALTAGFVLRFESKSVVHHYHEDGKIRQTFTSEEVKNIAYRNQFIFIWKNLTDKKLFVRHLCWLPIRLMQALLCGDFFMLAGFGKAVVRLVAIVNKRRECLRVKKLSDTEIRLF